MKGAVENGRDGVASSSHEGVGVGGWKMDKEVGQGGGGSGSAGFSTWVDIKKRGYRYIGRGFDARGVGMLDIQIPRGGGLT